MGNPRLTELTKHRVSGLCGRKPSPIQRPHFISSWSREFFVPSSSQVFGELLHLSYQRSFTAYKHKTLTNMRRLLLAAALLCTKLAVSSPDDGAHHGRHAKHHVHRPRDENAANKHQLSQDRQNPLEKQSSDANEGTRWGEDGYQNDPYINECLSHTNYHRDNHGAGPCQWDPWLAYTAQLVAQSCVFAHYT